MSIFLYGISGGLSDHVDCPEVERCPYYRGRDCMEFGLFGTMWTVRNREVRIIDVLCR